ncbi:MAG: DUF2752 domain-containing protein [Lachnospiraceae bacterium]|nr:DUF2752 domain-containing protein [Lachnospiraceae bacterium]
MDSEVKKRLTAELKLAAKFLCAGLIYALWFRITNIGIPCVFRLLTHLQCPGCGITRACVSILRLDFKSAFEYNPLSLTVVPLLALILLVREIRYIKKGKRYFNKVETAALAVMLPVTLIFAVYRNLPLLASWGKALGIL